MNRTKQSVQRESKQYYDNLSRIEEKIAVYTELDAPLYLLNQRDQAQQRITELEALLKAGDLPDEATPADVAAPFVSNVPPLPPHHVPREAELAALRALLLGEERQVAVTALRGMGGVGKTTLAIALCHDQAVVEAFPNGILWATLGPQADLLSWQATWGTMLGHDLTSLPDIEARASRLRSLLHDKRCLLVIDDVWDATYLPPMQVGGSQCATLVTTRERKIAQKVGVARDLDVLEPEQAIALLEKWAGEIAEDEKAVAGELARRLGYLPLALALAGAQAQDGETWDDLLVAFRDAQGADVTLLDLDDPMMRDESLKLAFDLSLERLSGALPEEFAMLGVFAAGREAPFAVEAAAAVWEVRSIQAKKALGRLVRAALLNRADDAYSLHLLLGDYARSRLNEATRRAAEARHSAYYLEVAQHSEEDWQATEAVLPQIRTAWSRVARDDADGLYAWAHATRNFFDKRGYWIDKRAWAESALTAVRAAGQLEREGWCELSLGVVYYKLTRLDEALAHYERSLTISREVGDRTTEAWSLDGIGAVHFERGEFDEAFEQYQASLTIFREVGNRKGEANGFKNTAYVHSRRGDLDAALVQSQIALVIYRELGDRAGEASTLNLIGQIHHQRGELDEALKQYQVGLTLYGEVGERFWMAVILNHIGSIHRQRGELDKALEQYWASLTIWRGVGNRVWEAWSLNLIGEIYLQQGKLEEALEQYQVSLTIYREAGTRVGEAELLNYIFTIYYQRGELEEALEQCQASLTIYREMGHRQGEAWSLNLIGRIHLQRGDLDAALEQYQASLAIFREVGNRRGEAWSLNLIGRIDLQRGDLDAALGKCQASLNLYREVGDRPGEAWSLNSIGEIHCQRGELEEALGKCQASLNLYREVGHRPGEAWSLNNSGEIYHQRGELDEALTQFQTSLAIMREVEDRAGQAESLRNMGNTYEQLGRLAEAEECLAQALALYEAIGMPEAEEVRKDLERVRGQLGGEGRDEG